MRVLFAGGGTGGHVYPSLSVARALEDELRARATPLELLYIGVHGRADEAIVPREGIAFRAIAAGQLRVASPLAFARGLLLLGRGSLQALGIMRRFRPDAVFATGGYASVPVGIAARLLRRPLVVYLPDVTPGWAVRLLARLATRVATTSEAALAHLPAKRTAVVGYPVRAAFWSLDWETARARLGLPQDRPVLLVAAGSLGAHAINDAVVAALPRLVARCSVLHMTGAADEARARAARRGLPEEQQARYVVQAYLDDMPAAMHAADLVVSRAGASTLGELPAAGAAAVLVPGEYEGWSQAPNARFLHARGAAVVVRNDELGRLADTVLALLDDEARLAAMRASMRALARPDAARDLARLVIEVAA
ncbi:MAG: undecaprenyldiphospho-muramoylpentapeptide beta-N-acetylglucosaminyltransferase [Chloroflexota bacterium]|nr:undecaprenyldiphospho-muramoylpentapeptide beta-N-acetylglucosaminyltransferase [Chloroflexota bacterium]